VLPGVLGQPVWLGQWAPGSVRDPFLKK
jgi:hypothetical protein